MATAFAGRSFLDLPAEIRLKIYRDLFGFGSTTIDSHDLKTIDDPQPKEYYVPEIVERSGQFLHTCKAICTDAGAVFYEQTIFKVNQHVDFFFYTAPENTFTGQINKMRHLEVDFKPEELENHPKKFSELKGHIQAARFEMLTTLKLTCHAIEWRPTFSRMNPRAESRTPFVIAYDIVELIGYTFLKNTSMNCMEDKSKDGVHVVFQLSMIAVPAQIGGRKTVSST